MKQRERIHRTAASTKPGAPNPTNGASRAAGGESAPGTQRVMAFQRTAGNHVTRTAVQRQYGMKPQMAAMLGSKATQQAQQAQAEQAEREDAEKKKKAEEFNAARATIQTDPRYQQMQADASSYSAKFIDVLSSALKGAMASAWEEGDKAQGYEGDSAGIFAGPSAGLDAYMEGNDEAYNFAVEMGSAHREKQEEQEGQMALDMASKILPSGGGMIASAVKTGGKALAGQAIKAKQATETIKVNKVLVRYLLGTPAQAPSGPLQEKYEAARLTVASKFGRHLAEFAAIEGIDSETLPDFKFATTELQTETTDDDVDWDAVPTRGRS
ncbi:MAG: hypothetical protein AB7F65_05535 [Dehalococcoidia bacterium]